MGRRETIAEAGAVAWTAERREDGGVRIGHADGAANPWSLPAHVVAAIGDLLTREGAVPVRGDLWIRLPNGIALRGSDVVRVEWSAYDDRCTAYLRLRGEQDYVDLDGPTPAQILAALGAEVVDVVPAAPPEHAAGEATGSEAVS